MGPNLIQAINQWQESDPPRRFGKPCATVSRFTSMRLLNSPLRFHALLDTRRRFQCLGQVPQPPERLGATIAAGSWALTSGTAGQVGAVYQAHPTIRVSGGTAPHPVQWASHPLLVSGATSRTALFRFTASASNPYPAGINVSCTATDASTPQQSATATGRISAYPQEPAPPQPPTADLSVVVSAGRWNAVSLGFGIVRYLSSARANADGGSGGYRYLWRVSGAQLTSFANAGPNVSLQSFTGAQATVSCTVTDSAGNSISGSAVIPAHGGVNP